ncbi:MAG: Smr/MutS family protein [Pseudomonadota bacterium]
MHRGRRGPTAQPASRDARHVPPDAARGAPERDPAADASPDETDLFRAAVRDVRPIGDAPRAPPPPPPPPRARFRRLDEEQVLAESLELGPGELLVETGDEMLFRRATLSGRVLERLRRGEFSVEDEVDLHGLTEVEAREAVRAFVNDALKRRLRCVRVSHGKGLRSGPRGPVLKHAVNTWLRKFDAVLAFASARQVDGGTGAVYVLLAR